MIIYTKHAEDKLKRSDIKKFKVQKKKIEKILKSAKDKSNTKYGEFAVIEALDTEHDLRIIYDIIGRDLKVITFYIARIGRYTKLKN